MRVATSRSRASQRLARAALQIGASVAALASAFYFLAREGGAKFGDADWYAWATPAWRGEQPLYPREWLGPHVAAYPSGFNLPPADALLGPIASTSTVLWGVLMAAALVAGLVVLWPRLPDPWDFYLVVALTAFWPVWSSLVWANVNSLVFLLLAVAYRWPRQAGWTIGAAAAIKASPVLVLAVLVGRREWRQVAIAVATAVVLTLPIAVVAGPETLVDFVRVQIHESHPPLDFGWSANELIGKPGAVVLALVLAAVAVARRGSWGWAIAATLVLVPTLWVHYWMWALVPVLGWLRTRYAATPAAELPAEPARAGVTPSAHPTR